ncbi:ATP-binding cassette domain-containing protein [Mucilaginibacter sp. HMF5004]|uniref:ABC transporter ATP-binding protein n=1 Tax=Mucilaginibacter rivuli TaxID=2857527 RepID=UPI001C6035E3|nr:ATP-binding cassette domain-containing protein [Mucilaginibacter rivuli]MBW4889513.1 ATP-binding cassette domain-containing protein [Mucilaginibacter rivuli]
MIELAGISKTFNHGKPTEVNALNGIDLYVEIGEFLVVVGSNGSGKSTLLNIIAGSISPTQGTVALDGRDVTDLADYQRSRYISRVFQNPLSGTAPDLSILDNFRLAALRTHPKSLKIGIDEGFKYKVMEKLSLLGMGLETKINQPMGTLSGGQRQALTLLMSVMANCKILLLDEPTAALDPRSADIVMRTADKLTHDFNLTTVLITHNLKDAFTYGQRIIQMTEGRIIHDLKEDEKAKLEQADIFKWFS